MPRDGSRSRLRVRAPALTILLCEACGRRGRYIVERLISEHGDAKLTYLPNTLSNDENRRGCAKILVLVRRLWAGLVFDELALIAQSLSLSALGVALVIFGSSPTKRKSARRRVGGDAQLGHAGARRDPAAPASAMAVANGEHRSRIAPARIVAAKRFVNVLLRQIEPPLLDLNRGIRQLRAAPTAGGANRRTATPSSAAASLTFTP